MRGVVAELAERRSRDPQPDHPAPCLCAERRVGEPRRKPPEHSLGLSRNQLVEQGDIDGPPPPQPALELERREHVGRTAPRVRPGSSPGERLV
jgi:hypothetical protein